MSTVGAMSGSFAVTLSRWGGKKWIMREGRNGISRTGSGAPTASGLKKSLGLRMWALLGGVTTGATADGMTDATTLRSGRPGGQPTAEGQDATGPRTVGYGPAMRAAVCDNFAEPEALEVRQLDTPPCGPAQIRVHVWASGVNYVDALSSRAATRSDRRCRSCRAARSPARSRGRRRHRGVRGRRPGHGQHRTRWVRRRDRPGTVAADPHPRATQLRPGRDDDPELRDGVVRVDPPHPRGHPRTGWSCWGPRAVWVWPPWTSHARSGRRSWRPRRPTRSCSCASSGAPTASSTTRPRTSSSGCVSSPTAAPTLRSTPSEASRASRRCDRCATAVACW